MFSFHSTLSRRDFMKGLGLTGVGVGAAAAVSPAFHDLDEMASSPIARINMPWWVKNVDEPTTPIDWNVLPTLGAAYDKNGGAVANVYPRAEYLQIMIDAAKKRDPNWVPGPSTLGVPGDSPDATYPDYMGDVKDAALSIGSALFNSTLLPAEIIKATGGKYSTLQDRPQAWRACPSIDKRGGTKYQASPEEALKVIRAAARFYGFDDVTAIPIDDKFLKVMWGQKRMLRAPFATKFEFGDVPDFVCTPEVSPMSKVIIPRSVKWYLHFSSRQLDITRWANGTTQNAGQKYTYMNWIRTVKTIQEFLWGLGYISFDNINARFAPTGAPGIMSGAGELSRWGGVMTPKYGIMVRVQHGVLTDLPLEQTSPIGFGGREFCKTCGICADVCPVDAIQKGEPSWEPNHPEFENPGYLHWRNDRSKCNHCPACQPACPFNAADKSVLHTVVKSTVATTPIFNTFFRNMDKSFGYGIRPPAEWWDSEQPVGGFDSTV
ncbi:MAG: reductive dehalogenase [Dehalogenimonas sp.]